MLTKHSPRLLLLIVLLQPLSCAPDPGPGAPPDPTLDAREAATELLGPAQLHARFQGAPRVVVGTVRNVTPFAGTNEYGDRLIMRRVEVDVEATVRGAPSAHLVFELEGGELGDRGVAVSDQPELAVGDRGVFGVRPRRDGRALVPWGRSRGVLLVARSESAERLREAVEEGR